MCVAATEHDEEQRLRVVVHLKSDEGYSSVCV